MSWLAPKDIPWPDGTTYLRRWHLLPRRWALRFYLHRIFLPDAGRDPHCHPSWFVTAVLRGGYVEAVYDDRGSFLRLEVRNAGDVIYRPATYVHRIVSVRPGTWTLSLWGPRTREWGFYQGGKFIPHTEYVR